MTTTMLKFARGSGSKQLELGLDWSKHALELRDVDLLGGSH